MLKHGVRILFSAISSPSREQTAVMRNQPSSPDMTIETALPSKIVRIVVSLTCVAALLVVTAGLGAPPAVAWDPKFSTPLTDPMFPVLPGGVVGPALDAGAGRATESTMPHAAHDTTGDAVSDGQQAPLVPPPADTWEQAVESNARLTGNEMPTEIDDGRSQRRRVGIALGLVGAIGILAVMAAVRGANPRLPSKSPLSVLRNRATHSHRPREADHERSKRPELQRVGARIDSQNA